MAEALCKIGDNGTYEDKDILCAFNNRRIWCVHAEHICHPKLVRDSENPFLHLAQDTLPEMMLIKTMEFKFERISSATVRKELLILPSYQDNGLPDDNIGADGDRYLDLATNDIYKRAAGFYELEMNVYMTMGDTPNIITGERIEVREFLESRLNHHSHMIFGSEGLEIWYGGNRDVSMTKVDAVWTQIETDTAYLKADYGLWPLSDTEKKRDFAVSLVDFTDQDSSDMVDPQRDLVDPEIIIKKRKNKIDYNNLSGISSDTRIKIADRTITVDGRTKATYTHTDIVIDKSA